MDFTCEVKIYEKDYLQFNYCNSKKTIYIIIFIYSIIMFLISFHSSHILISSLIISLLVAVFLWLLFLLSNRIRSKWVYKSNQLLQAKLTIYIDKNGIHEISDISKINTSFENVYKVYESKHALYIYIAKNAAIIIPKRAIQSAFDIEKLRGLLRSNIDPKKLRLTANR